MLQAQLPVAPQLGRSQDLPSFTPTVPPIHPPPSPPPLPSQALPPFAQARRDKQVLFFSATWPPSVERSARALCRAAPRRVALEPEEFEDRGGERGAAGACWRGLGIGHPIG